MGLEPTSIGKSRYEKPFTAKSFAAKNFSHSGCSSSFPIIARWGGQQQGQNRDKSIAHVQPVGVPFGLLILIAPLMALVSGDGAEGASQRRRVGRQPSPSRGLPDDQTLVDMASMYLDFYQQHRPDLVKSGVLPAPSPAAATRLAEEFKRDFLNPDWAPSREKCACPPGVPLASDYLRYSSDNSNPRSLPQQLRNCLEAAERLGAFVPWEFVFADAAVTGTVASRRGYQMAKSAIGSACAAGILVIDELGRAARDAIEALKLGRLVEASKKRLVGASDSFDSTTAHARLLLSIYAMLHAWFVEQLRAKVNRGMRDAFDRGENIRPPGFGYKLVVRLDVQGNIIYDRKGRPDLTKIIDDEGAQFVLQIFTLFVEKRWSSNKIARHFNELKVGGRTSWDSSYIRRRILENRTYIGEECCGMTRQVRDPDTGKVTVERLPEDQWQRRSVPHLRIVSEELWNKAQARLAECRSAYRSPRTSEPGRASVYPTTLVRPVCGCCGRELRLGRSGDHPSFCCPNGILRRKGCQFNKYKSVRIVEDCVLAHVKAAILLPEFVRQLVNEANRYLEAEARRPPEDTEPLRRNIKSAKAKLKRVSDQLRQRDSETVVNLIVELEQQVKDWQRQLAEAEAQQPPSLPAITEEDVVGLLNDLRELLAQEKELAAPILRQLTGPIVVTQEKQNGAEKPTLFAKFELNAVPVLAELSARKQCPTAGNWEYLKTRDWTLPIPACVPLAKQLKYESWAPQMQRLRDAGASVNEIATIYKTSWNQANEILQFAETGKRPTWKRPNKAKSKRSKRASGARQEPKYRRYADLVDKLRTEEKMPFEHMPKYIFEKFGENVDISTVKRAYDFAHPDDLRTAAERGEAPDRGPHVHIREEKHRQIRELLRAKATCDEIARQLGCSARTVHREKRKMKGT
jgi:DNA invertase Pin-like site-specific DNA recombinase